LRNKKSSGKINIISIGSKYMERNDSKFEKKEVKITPSLIILGMLFASVLIASNVTGAKLVDLGTLSHKFTVSIALLFFPLTYIVSDIITEVYGFKVCRFIIWSGLACNILFLIMIFLATVIPPSVYFTGQKAFEVTLFTSCRIFLASVLSFFAAEMVNSIFLSKLKIYFNGKLLPLRIIFSTATGVVFGSLIFYQVAFFGAQSQWLIFEMMMVELVIKILYDVCCLPATCYFCKLLKRVDGVDHYDYNIKYNPFVFWKK
jgi:queuosine precursor transporter